MRLDQRLQTIVNLLEDGKTIVDVGSDHAYLLIYLLQNERFTKGIGIEKNQGPYQAAQRNIRLNQLLKSVEIRLGDGLIPVEPQEAQTVVLAGMGGLTISQILLRDQTRLRYTQQIVVQPQNAPDKTRKTLCDVGFIIDQERLIKVVDRFYVVISAVKGSCSPLSWANLHFGPKLLESRPEYLVEYMQGVLDAKERIFQKMALAAEPPVLKMQVWQKEILAIRKLMEEYEEND